ncbi:hypothetical protein EV126DRAFT_513583 [Verticillium dahliae]|nr:hypothetical protein EV126DRAFT_513583 [Verticillium dahliae]
MVSAEIDRAFQWLGKVGGEKTAHSDEFKNLETEMTLRHEGMEKLQKSTNGSSVDFPPRRGSRDKEKAVPIGFVGRMMLLVANERIAETQEAYAAEVNQNCSRPLSDPSP